jgi:NADH-quinone oxidoreductase subunit L
MREDPGYPRFMAYLNLFMAAMLVLVLADNLVLLFLGWEGVGLCSYLLIGFWYQDFSNCAAAIKAFVVNRIGDLGFLLGIFLAFATFGTTDLSEINAAVAGKPAAALFGIAILLFVGATGKSAQIPLYVWLPDAMAGPTPVSALIHAATMVTSGVYLLARLQPLYLAAPAVLGIVAGVAVATALLAALIALAQTDIKKVLAYSTVSQLGYMFFAAGMGAFSIAVFHLVTHAFFKALLFLGAGAVIHSLHHEQDMRKMGGLARVLPRTFAVFTIGALALAGFPLFSGFFSKDAILHQAMGLSFDHGFHPGWFILWLLAFATAAITAFYTFRQVALVFLGERRTAHDPGHGDGSHGTAHDSHGSAHGAPGEVHESPPVMMVPLYVLAVLAAIGGFFAVPAFLDGPASGEHHGSLAGEILGWTLGGAAAVAGIAAALALYWKRPQLRAALASRHALYATFRRLSQKKFYVDELYRRAIVIPFERTCEALFYLVDRALIDWLMVGGAALFVRVLGRSLRAMQSGRAPAYAAWFVGGVLVLLTVILWAAG